MVVRRLLALAAALSFLLCVAVAVLWIGSYRGYTGLAILHDVSDPGPGGWGWQNWFIYRGKAGIIFSGTDVGMNSVESFGAGSGNKRWTGFGEASLLVSAALQEAETGSAPWSRVGFSCCRKPEGYWNIIVPLWPLVVFFAILPARVCMRAYAMRQRSGHCNTCGYNLCATPDRCPECGTPVSKMVEACE